MLYDKQGDVVSALKDYNKAIELNCSNSFAYNSRALLFANRHFDSALKDYNESIRLNPKCASTYNNRGSLLFSQGNFEAALIDYTAAINLEPYSKGRAHTYLNRGILHQLAGRYEAAGEDINSALNLDTNVYGIVSQFFATRIERNPHDMFAVMMRGMIARVKGEEDNAMHDLQQVADFHLRIHTAVQQQFVSTGNNNNGGINNINIHGISNVAQLPSDNNSNHNCSEDNTREHHH